MSIEIGNLIIGMQADVARLQSDMNKSVRIVDDSTKSIQRAANMAKNALELIGVGVSISSFVGFIKHSIDAADSLNDLSQKVGVNIQKLAGYKLAADQSGTSLEAVAKGIKGLSGNIVENSDKLAKLGITAKDTDGAMLQVADLFSSLPDGVEKTTLAVKLFGKSGMDMIPMLNGGSAGLAEAQAKAAEYGRQMKELAPQADGFNDQLAQLSLQASIAGINLGSLVAGPMTQWLEANNEAIRIAGGLGEALRLFVFNLDAMTTEKPAEEIRRLTKALQDYQAASGFGKFMQSPTGFLFGGREDDLKKQIAFLGFLKKQQERDPATQTPTATEKTPEQIAAEIKKQREITKKVNEILGEWGSSSKTDKFAELMKDINTRNAILSAENDSETKLTETQKFAITVKEKLADATLKLIPTQRNQLDTSLKTLLALDQENESRKQLKVALAAQADVMKQITGDFDRQAASRLSAMEIISASDRALIGEYEKISKSADDARQSATKFYTDGKLSADQFKASMKQISDEEERQKETVRALQEKQDLLNGSWQYGAKNALQSYMDSVRNVASETQQAVSNAFKGMEDALVKFVTTGKLDFRSLADSIIADIIRIQIRESITGTLATAASSFISDLLKPTPNAAGGVYAGAGISAYSSTVVDRPTLFPFARGVGLMGEAGPEAILPLKRINGRLGVQADGAGAGVTVNIINQAGAQVSTQERRDPNGGMSLDVIIEQVEGGLARNISRGSGDLSGTLERTFGLNRTAGAYR